VPKKKEALRWGVVVLGKSGGRVSWVVFQKHGGTNWGVEETFVPQRKKNYYRGGVREKKKEKKNEIKKARGLSGSRC